MRPRARYSRVALAVVEPRGRHRPPELGKRARVVLAKLHEREDRLRVDRHLRLRALDPVPGEELVVVGDDAVVHADDRAVPDRVVVGLDVRMAFREVPDVDERLAASPPAPSSSSSSALAPPRSFVTRVGRLSPRWAYPTASAPRSAMPASSACAASVRSTDDSGSRLNPAMPHMRWSLRRGQTSV